MTDQVASTWPTLLQPKSLRPRLANSVRAHLSNRRRPKGSFPGRDVVKVGESGQILFVARAGTEQSAEVPTSGRGWQEAYQCLSSGSDVADDSSRMPHRRHHRFHSLVTPRLGLGNVAESREQPQRRKCSFTIVRPTHQQSSQSLGRSSTEGRRESSKPKIIHIATEPILVRPSAAEASILVPLAPPPVVSGSAGPRRKPSPAPLPPRYTIDIELLTQKLEQVALQREIRMSIAAEEKRLQRAHRKALPIRGSVALDGEQRGAAGERETVEAKSAQDYSNTVDVNVLQTAIKVAQQRSDTADTTEEAAIEHPIEASATMRLATGDTTNADAQSVSADVTSSPHSGQHDLHAFYAADESVKTLVDKEQQTSVLSVNPPPLLKVDIGTDVPSLLAYAPTVAKQHSEPSSPSSSSVQSSCDHLQMLHIYRDQVDFPTSSGPQHPQQQGQQHHPARRVHSDPVPLNQLFVQPSSMQAAASHGALLDTLRPVACYDAFGLPTTSVSACASPGGILAPVADARVRSSPLWECHTVGLGLTFIDDDVDGDGQHQCVDLAHEKVEMEAQRMSNTSSPSRHSSPRGSVGHERPEADDDDNPSNGNKSGCSPSRRSSAISRQEPSGDKAVFTSAEAEVSLTSFLSLCNGSEMDWVSLGVPTELCCEQDASAEEVPVTNSHIAPAEPHLPGHYPSTSTLQARYHHCPKSVTCDDDSDSDVSFASIRLWRQVVALESPHAGAADSEDTRQPHVAKWKARAQSKQLVITAATAFSDDFKGVPEPVMASRFSDDSASSASDGQEGREFQEHRKHPDRSRLRYSLETVRQTGGGDVDVKTEMARSSDHDAFVPSTTAVLGDSQLPASASALRPPSISAKCPSPIAVVNVTPPTPPARQQAPTKSVCSTPSTCGTRVGKRRLSSADAQRVFDRYFPTERDRGHQHTRSTSATRASAPPLDLLLADRLGSAGDALTALRVEILKRHCGEHGAQ